MKPMLIVSIAGLFISTVAWSQTGSKRGKRSMPKIVCIEPLGPAIPAPSLAELPPWVMLHLPVERPSTIIFIDDCKPLSRSPQRVPPVWIPDKPMKRPRRDFSNAVFNAGGTETETGNFYLLGSRTGPLVFIDDVKTRGTPYVPMAAVAEINVLRLGIPADIGDSVSGYLVINTR